VGKKLKNIAPNVFSLAAGGAIEALNCQIPPNFN